MTQDEEIALLRRQVADLTDRVARLEPKAPDWVQPWQTWTPGYHPISVPSVWPFKNPTSGDPFPGVAAI